jgi:hypothetical protein
MEVCVLKHLTPQQVLRVGDLADKLRAARDAIDKKHEIDKTLGLNPDMEVPGIPRAEPKA